VNKTRAFLSIMIIILALATVGGATMAWFSVASDPLENSFTAGYLQIEAGGKTRVLNWNPGDNSESEFCVKNIGSKKSLVRIGLDGEWRPGPLRILVLYTADNIQLIGVEWDSYCQGCTGKVGPMATGTATYSYSSSSGPEGRILNNDYYFGTTFSNLQQPENWLENSKLYKGWCLDHKVSFNPSGSFEVDIYDPFCNPDWYNEATDSDTLKARWAAIDFDKISYIINHDFLSRGYISTEIQQAIWNYSNGSYYTDRYYLGNTQEIVDYIDNIGDDIVEALNAIPETVSWELHSDSSANWISKTNNGKTYFYYNGVFGDDEEQCLKLIVKLSGPNTGNMFQGMTYTASGYFEAVQASNNASGDQWGVDSEYDPEDEMTAANWIGFDF